MDKKKLVKTLPPEELKGFEEFIEGEPSDSSFLPKPQGALGNKKESSFEHFTFLTNDADRLQKLKDVMKDKVPFTQKFEQGEALVRYQQEELSMLRAKIFEATDKKGSAYLNSITEIFDSYFEPPKP